MTATATGQLIKPHGGALVDRTGERPEGVESLERLELTSREVSDLDMLASGALSPLEGFMGPADYERVVQEMHLDSGLPWALPVCLAVDAAPPSRHRGARRQRRAARGAGGGRGLRIRQGARGGAVLPHHGRKPSRRCAAVRPEAAVPLGTRDRVRAAAAVLSGARAGSRRDAGRVRRARLEARRRVPDAEPDPPRARVPDQGGARDRRRALDPPARRGHEVGRRPRGHPRRVLPRAAGRATTRKTVSCSRPSPRR